MTISFIIPTLNEESVLEKLLKNLKSVTAVDCEIIVSDGKSTDKTLEIAGRYGVKIAGNASGRRQTIGEGRNRGAALATGEYLVFLDADVYIPEPDKFFARALDKFKLNPRLKGLSGWVRVFPETETWADYLGYVILSDWQFYIKNNWFHSGSTCGEFQMMTAEVYRELGGYREDLTIGEDIDLFYRISKLGRTKTDPKLLVYHTGRRPHKIGWPRLIWQWVRNSLHVTVFDRSHSKEWKVIR
ncbi:MAG: glycosyltransferase [Candidatus Doudnabacteria bacterium]|nr:glycosyltransferase [Candidatus Doudnabacteria bacterium]